MHKRQVRLRQLPFLILGVGLLIASMLLGMKPGNAIAQSTLLYDGLPGQLPSEQGFVFATDPNPPAGASQQYRNGGTLLISRPWPSDKAGYFARRELQLTLDRQAGYSLSFTFQIQDEIHINQHRAGFSVLLIGNDWHGIELGFWADEVFAQNDGAAIFTHGESASFDFSSSEQSCIVTVDNDTYTLSCAGRGVLAGRLRNYSSGGEPYTLGNTVFLGDNTSSAGATLFLRYVAIETNLRPVVTSTPTQSNTPSASPEPAPKMPVYLPLLRMR